MLFPLVQEANSVLAHAVAVAKEAGRFSTEASHGEITAPNWVFSFGPARRDRLVFVYHFPTNQANLLIPYPPFALWRDRQRPGQIPPAQRVEACMANPQATAYGPLHLVWHTRLVAHPGKQFTFPAFNMFNVRTNSKAGDNLHSELFPNKDDLLDFLHHQADLLALLIQCNGAFLDWRGMRVSAADVFFFLCELHQLKC
jgi:hypothetical protein